jgi:uncharacterized protein (TIGR02453 family)
MFSIFYFYHFAIFDFSLELMNNKLILDFLTKLKVNNEREWFHANKPEYEKVKLEFKNLVQEMITKIIPFDEGLIGLETKNSIFRINRDVRFSKDKRPYKENVGASFTRGGKKSKFVGYYLHISPDGNSFLAGGSYMPPSNHLSAIRQEIDYNASEIKDVISKPKFKKLFGELEGESLKTSPKGYPKDHAEIVLLRRKSFIMMHKLTDDEVLKPDFVEFALGVFKEMKPLNDFLNRAIDGVEE